MQGKGFRKAWRLTSKAALHVLAGGGAVIMALPFIWMLSTSFKPESEVFQFPPRFIPNTITVANYINLFQCLNFIRYFLNTSLVAILITLGSLFINSLAGYAFAKIKFRGRDPLFMGILATMMVPGSVTLIPSYLLIKSLGMVNTYAGLILPGLASAFGIFLMRQFIRTIPNELIEAAQIDGASEFWIFLNIILPLSKPALATLGLFTFMGSWNNFLWPLIIATDERMYTLPVAIAVLRGQHGGEFALQMAGAAVVVAPILIVFLLLQRYYISGIALTGMKG